METTTTKTKRKVSLGIKIASILTCVALLSVGFASWLILQPVQNATETGSFTVYTVEENNIRITATPVDANDTTIVFGKEDNVTENWLVASNYDGTAVENDNLATEFTVEYTSSNLNLAEVVDNLVFTMEVPSAYTTAVTAGAVANPVLSYTYQVYDDSSSAYGTAQTGSGVSGLTITQALTDIEAKKVKLNVTITFDWGTTTGGENPYKYYNSLDYSTPNSLAAKTLLQSVYGLNGLNYSLTASTSKNSGT